MSSDGKDEEVIAEIRMLEKEVLSSLEKVNSLAALLKHLRSESDAVVFQALKSGQRIFNHFLGQFEISHNGVRSSKGTYVSLKRGKAALDEKVSATLSADPQYQVRVWLRKRYFEFGARLLELLYHEEVGLQLPALSALMDLERLAGQNSAGAPPKFANAWMPWIVAIIAHSAGDSVELTAEFLEKFVKPHDDVRLYLFLTCASLLNAYNPESKTYFTTEKDEELKLPKRMPYLKSETEFHDSLFSLMIAPPMAAKAEDLNCFWVQPNNTATKNKKSANPKKRKRIEDLEDSDELDLDNIALADSDEEEEAAPEVHRTLLDLSVHKAAFSKAWLALLGRKLEVKLHVRILNALERQVLPFMSAPVTLFDYLSHCFTSGGMLGILSLGGLFVLLRRYNVEYPDFFPRLYRLLEPSVFYIKHRKRFFELLSLFLEGANLPLYMLTAFLKRFSRLSLAVSPSISMLLLAIVYRVLIKHPATHVLLHRTHNYDPKTDNEESPANASVFPFMPGKRLNSLADDPYDMDQPDPSKCRAIESSLWEMKSLANHAVPAVATLAMLLFGGNELKMAHLSISDFTEESYQSMFEQEQKRKTKNASTNFQLPKYLFDKQTLASYNFLTKENLIGFQDSQLVQHESGPTSSAIYAEKKKRKSFAELKAERKKKEQSRVKRPRFAM